MPTTTEEVDELAAILRLVKPSTGVRASLNEIRADMDTV